MECEVWHALWEWYDMACTAGVVWHGMHRESSHAMECEVQHTSTLWFSGPSAAMCGTNCRALSARRPLRHALLVCFWPFFSPVACTNFAQISDVTTLPVDMCRHFQKSKSSINVSTLYCAGVLAVRTDAVCAGQLPVDRRLHNEAALLEHGVLRPGVLGLLSPPELLFLPVLQHPCGHSPSPGQRPPRDFRNVQTCNIFVMGFSAYSLCIGRPATGGTVLLHCCLLDTEDRRGTSTAAQRARVSVWLCSPCQQARRST